MENGLESQEPDLFSDTQYIDDTGGGEHYAVPTTNTPWDIFMVGNVNPNTFVLYGGQLDMAASLGNYDASSMSSYQTLCSGKFYPLFGIGASPFCSMMAMMRFSKIMTWLLLGLDLFVMVWYLLKYIPGYLSRFWAILTGNKRLVGKVINNL